MRTSLLFALTLTHAAPSMAQEIPGETAGDLGWILHGLDTLTLVRAADGHAWLQQNLGATEVATATSAAESYGDLYQWGRWEDGHQLRTSAVASVTTLAINNPSGLGLGTVIFYIGTDPLHWWSGGNAGDSWQGTSADTETGIDPCTTLGEAWQLPSQADWIAVLAAEGITDMVTALASNLRLPAAGSRHALTGTLINEGSFGNYWSSTPSTSYAKDVTIGSGFVNPDDDAYRGYGMSCRCLHKNLHIGWLEQEVIDLALFPNPAMESFTLRSGERVERITILDALGRTVATVAVNGTSAIVDLPATAQGMHIVRVETAGGILRAALMIGH